MADCVLDASALLQVARLEPGWRTTLPRLRRGAVSAVNLGETLAKLVRDGTPPDAAEAALAGLAFDVRPFTPEQGRLVAAIRARAGKLGLSLGDCACLATARSLGLPALTLDRAWLEADFGVAVELASRFA